jgi:hypothetical protein
MDKNLDLYNDEKFNYRGAFIHCYFENKIKYIAI